jgi:hypothetical protein
MRKEPLTKREPDHCLAGIRKWLRWVTFPNFFRLDKVRRNARDVHRVDRKGNVFTWVLPAAHEGKRISPTSGT